MLTFLSQFHWILNTFLSRVGGRGGGYQAICGTLLPFREISFKLSNPRERERIEFKIVSPVNRDSNRVQDSILKDPWGAQHNMFFTGSCLQCLLYTIPSTHSVILLDFIICFTLYATKIAEKKCSKFPKYNRDKIDFHSWA